MMVLAASVLGLRHGFDLDHLATIDAITRTQSHHPLLSRWVGVLFSLGHGIVVTAASLLVSTGLFSTHVPSWIDGLGKMISVFFLILFGSIALWNVLFSSKGREVPCGIKSFLAKKLRNKTLSPLMLLSIGALFALSFDTLSQVALFAMTGSLTEGFFFAGLLAVSFTFGMILSDGINGLFICSLIQKAGKVSSLLSKGLGLAICLFSFYLGILGLIDLLS